MNGVLDTAYFQGLNLNDNDFEDYPQGDKHASNYLHELLQPVQDVLG